MSCRQPDQHGSDAGNRRSPKEADLLPAGLVGQSRRVTASTRMASWNQAKWISKFTWIRLKSATICDSCQWESSRMVGRDLREPCLNTAADSSRPASDSRQSLYFLSAAGSRILSQAPLGITQPDLFSRPPPRLWPQLSSRQGFGCEPSRHLTSFHHDHHPSS